MAQPIIFVFLAPWCSAIEKFPRGALFLAVSSPWSNAITTYNFTHITNKNLMGDFSKGYPLGGYSFPLEQKSLPLLLLA